jgi:sugar lactone lactonase YvrE
VGASQVLAVDLKGNTEVVVHVPEGLSAIDFLPDGRMLIAPRRGRHRQRRESDGRLVTHADLSIVSDYPWNDMVVDSRGNICIGNFGFILAGSSEPGDCHGHAMARPDRSPTTVRSRRPWS